MIDLPRLPGDVTAQDFVFKVGSDNTPSGWAVAPAPTSITRRPGAGAGGADRVTLIWADGAIRNAWLQVTVKANARTGLAADDTFYFGNLAGDTEGIGTPRVNALDLAGVKRALNTNSAVDGRYDVNRDGRVNALDLGAIKQNLNRSLPLLSAPAGSLASALTSATASIPSGRGVFSTTAVPSVVQSVLQGD
jgi:hypothetical protein